MELITDTFYKKHLYFENSPKSREYQLTRCMNVLGMIAQLKDRNKRIESFSIEMYGRDANGQVMATESDYYKFVRNVLTIERLKRYYNYCLKRVDAFQIELKPKVV